MGIWLHPQKTDMTFCVESWKSAKASRMPERILRFWDGINSWYQKRSKKLVFYTGSLFWLVMLCNSLQTEWSDSDWIQSLTFGRCGIDADHSQYLYVFVDNLAPFTFAFNINSCAGALWWAHWTTGFGLRTHGDNLSISQSVSTQIRGLQPWTSSRNAEDMNLYEAIKGRRHYLPEQKVWSLRRSCHKLSQWIRVSMSWSLHPTGNGSTLPMEFGCTRYKISID